MIRVAIIDDEENERISLKNEFNKIASSQNLDFSFSLFSSGEDFLKQFDRSFDIICLDIDMPEKNGIDTAAEIRKTDEDVIILFVTNMAQMAIRGYEVQAMDFILKPVNEYSFSMKMKNAMKILQQKNDRIISVQTQTGFVTFRTSELIYAEVQGHYIYYHTKSGIYHQKGSLKELEIRLESLPFSKCNQCYLVNLKYVSSVNGEEVLVGKDWLKISRPRKKQFLDEVSGYLGGI